MSNHSSVAVYPAAPVSAPASQQQNLQPQQYSPLARYPAPGPAQSQTPGAAVNPCYQAPPSGHDMRSPRLMSPTQAPIPGAVPQAGAGAGLAPPMVNSTPLQRSISNMEMQPNSGAPVGSQHMRMVPQTTPFYGHDPSVASSGMLLNYLRSLA
ncbi:unnamed protein product [Gongylonema pulchrum]|uniref:Uncharacterized protein n=1 Tax=Gongylonema pulchrum TaxID=637853 RepID=A0A3P7PDS2_9BILA|nr:unnamed protein product [Gongylonema pulchrum]